MMNLVFISRKVNFPLSKSLMGIGLTPHPEGDRDEHRRILSRFLASFAK